MHFIMRYICKFRLLLDPHKNGHVAVNWNAYSCFLHFHPYSFSFYILHSQFFALYAGHSVPFRALAATRVYHRNVLIRRADLGASPSCVYTCAYARNVTAISNEILYFQRCSWRFAANERASKHDLYEIGMSR